MKHISVLLFACVVGCSQGNLPKAGSNLVAPFSLATTKIGSASFLYVLNSAAYGEYSDGSLHGYAIGNDGKPLLRHVVDVSAYGTQVATNANGSLLATGYVGDTGKIQIFSLDTTGAPKHLYELMLPKTGSLQGLFFFEYGGSTYLSVAQNSNSVGGKVHVWKWTGTALERVFVLPDDLATIPNAETIGYTSPVFINNRLVAFPSASASTLASFSELPAKDFTIDKWSQSGKGDPRVFSAAVVDFPTLMLSQSLNSSVAFVPMIVKPDSTKDDKYYRTYFASVLHSSASGCDANAVLVADDSSGIIWKVGGLTANMSSNFAAPALKDKLVSAGSFTAQNAVSSVSDSGFSMGTLKMAYANSQSCKPFWLKNELRDKGEGNSPSWLQWVSTADASKLQSFGFSDSLRGIVSFSILDDYFYAVSYSQNRLISLKYTTNELKFN